jgi:hypothetical protein
LKQAAGDPSYDRMRDELGALASKSALSAAARGDRLPSWDTAWEFARVLAVGVLGQDEDRARRYWRAAWETAAHPEPAPAPEPQPAPAPAVSGRAGLRYAPALAGVAAATIAALAGFRLGRRRRWNESEEMVPESKKRSPGFRWKYWPPGMVIGYHRSVVNALNCGFSGRLAVGPNTPSP